MVCGPGAATPYPLHRSRHGDVSQARQHFRCQAGRALASGVARLSRSRNWPTFDEHSGSGGMDLGRTASMAGDAFAMGRSRPALPCARLSAGLISMRCCSRQRTALFMPIGPCSGRLGGVRNRLLLPHCLDGVEPRGAPGRHDRRQQHDRQCNHQQQGHELRPKRRTQRGDQTSMPNEMLIVRPRSCRQCRPRKCPAGRSRPPGRVRS